MEFYRQLPRDQVLSYDLVLTNGKTMVRALPMALPGGPQDSWTTLGYDI